MSPAWSVRTLQEPLPLPIDLSLERGLAALQQPDGGFDLCEALAAVLGLPAAGSTLAAAAGGSDALTLRVVGALLALKTAAFYKSEGWSPGLQQVCRRAEAICCQQLGLSPQALWAALEALRPGGCEATPQESGPLPELAVALIQEAFHPEGGWGVFDAWVQLIPAEAALALRDAELVLLCPRFFVVDLACAPLSHYEVEHRYTLYRKGNLLFVGRNASEEETAHDAMRQGRQLEAAAVQFGWTEEDRVLTELRLGGLHVIYAAAPDALEAAAPVAAAPPSPGDVLAYEDAGYVLESEFPVQDHAGRPVGRLWRSTACEPPRAEAYWEVKKTTHLNGAPGEFKRLKYWLQAALMGCAGALVATTEGAADPDVVCRWRRLSLAELAKGLPVERVWANLLAMLRHIAEATAPQDGPCLMSLQKARGPGAPVRLGLQKRLLASADVAESAQEAFARVYSFLHAEPEPWPEDEDWRRT